MSTWTRNGLRYTLRGSSKWSITSRNRSLIRGKVTNTNMLFVFGNTNNIKENMSALLNDEQRIVKSIKNRSIWIINDGLIDHAFKNYSLTIEDITQKVITRSSHWNEGSEKMHYNAYNIIESSTIGKSFNWNLEPP